MSLYVGVFACSWVTVDVNSCEMCLWDPQPVTGYTVSLHTSVSKWLIP